MGSFNLKVNCELLESCILLSDILQHNMQRILKFLQLEVFLGSSF